MSKKNQLRETRTGTVINNTSEKREGKAAAALNEVIVYISKNFNVNIDLDRI